ncbi:biotin transporter BioY [Demequina sp. NBRC 110051]|uniref:biotin transporter BioY n=1 Tax=Demequina sp. NBRC 110051 TaxID=1570340 RepID=UPI001180A9B3|nr:biotin transporter BioY [Demequina sp. NBRC 110051]
MSPREALSGANIALIAVFAAFIAASTLVPEITLAFGVPFSLQTLAVVLAGLCLGPWRGMAAVVLYILVGFAGAPVFANLSAGLGVLAGPTGGFLLGFIPAAGLVGALTMAARRRGRLGYPTLLLAGLASIPVTYAVGIPWLSVRTGLSLADATVAMAPFMVGDVVKVAIAAGVAAVIHRAYPRLLPPARPAASAPDSRKARATA